MPSTPTTFDAIRDTWENTSLFFTPKTIVLHDTMDNPVFTDWLGADGSVNTPPTTIFGAGNITDSTGISIKDDLKWKEITSQGYSEPVIKTLESETKTFTLEYQQTLRREILAEVTGVDVPENLSANGTLSILQGGTPVNKGLRTYIINYEDTPDGLMARIDILPRCVVSDRPDFEIKGSDPSYNKVEYSIYRDTEAGFTHMTVLGGSAFVKNATNLGYKTA